MRLFQNILYISFLLSSWYCFALQVEHNVYAETFTAIAELNNHFHSTFTSIHHIVNEFMAALSNPHQLSQQDIMLSTYTISSPGYYLLQENISFNPLIGQPAIHILSDDVILDFNSKALVQTNNVPLNSAIHIADSVSNITIRNGTIKGFTGEGIICGLNCHKLNVIDICIMHMNGIGIEINGGCSQCAIENILISDTNSGGILLNGDLNLSPITQSIISNARIYSCTGLNGQDAFGLRIRGAQDIEVTECVFKGNGAYTSASGFGVDIISSELCNFTHCCADRNEGNFIGAGFSISLSGTCIFSHCQSLNNLAHDDHNASVATGFYIDRSTRLIFDHCKSNGNTHTVQHAIGFISSYGSMNHFYKCFAFNNIGANAAAGIQLTAESDSNIMQCQLQSNHTTASGTAYGIYLSGNMNDRITVANNIIIANIGASASRGIEDERSNSTSLFIKNRAFNNGTNYVIGYPTLISLPTIVASLSDNVIGLPSLQMGELDNLDARL